MSDSKTSVTQNENGTPVSPLKRSKRRMLINSFKRFWWLYLLVLCLFILLATLLLMFVAVPAIVHDKINSAKLNIDGVDVLDTKPESFHMSINSTLRTNGGIHAKVDPFNGNLYFDQGSDQAFATLRFPPTNNNKHQVVNISQDVQIMNMDALKMFNIALLQQETVQIRVEGKTKVKPAGIARKPSATFRKILTLKGLNRFQGIVTRDAKIDIAASKGSPNFRAIVDIPNDSVFALELGNTTYRTTADNQYIGDLTIKNLTVRPGITSLPVEAELDQAKILGIVSKRPYCENGIVPINLMGTDVVNHGQRLEYFIAAVSATNITVEMDIGAILKSTLGSSFSLSCI
ncbi:hypothetical protein CDD82_3959 [Ophiocordyceps australis]|uniref:Uncharacterized protein n=1 Tax=Ophiocordyceps australis TaxID=1399860 RepID=A0A2C5XLZ9_9HYPO|nr:hypothetical protein CDD82_3959 [Ophiocordyceps australis]